MRVLLAVDGSSLSDAAVAAVATRTWPDQTEIQVITAYELPLAPAPETWALPPDYFEKLDQAARDHAETVERCAVLKLRQAFEPGVKISGSVLAGTPRSVILAAADHWKADLIVIGSHGYGAWQRFLLGSVSQSIVSHAKCSVEVVRIREAETADARAA